MYSVYGLVAFILIVIGGVILFKKKVTLIAGINRGNVDRSRIPLVLRGSSAVM